MARIARCPRWQNGPRVRFVPQTKGKSRPGVRDANRPALRICRSPVTLQGPDWDRSADSLVCLRARSPAGCTPRGWRPPCSRSCRGCGRVPGVRAARASIFRLRSETKLALRCEPANLGLMLNGDGAKWVMTTVLPPWPAWNRSSSQATESLKRACEGYRVIQAGDSRTVPARAVAGEPPASRDSRFPLLCRLAMVFAFPAHFSAWSALEPCCMYQTSAAGRWRIGATRPRR